MTLAGDPILWMAPAGLLIGAWAGLSGYSGWPLVVPMLFVVLGRPLHESLAASMVVDCVNSASASVVYVLRGDADVATARRWVIGSVPLILLGVAVSFAWLPRFAGAASAAGPIAFVLGGALLVRAARSPEKPSPVAGVGARSVEPLQPGTRRTLLRGGLGLNAIGMGLVGMGGAFNVAMLMMLLRREDPLVGVGTGLLFTSLALPVALGAYLWMLQPHFIGPWRELIPFAACSAFGAGFAARQGSRIPARAVGFVVGGCVLSAGVVAMVQQWVIS